MLPKMVANSLAPAFAILGVLCSILGGVFWSPPAIISGLAGGLISVIYVVRVTTSHADFEKTFGPNWLESIPQIQQQRLSQKRWVLWHSRSPEVRWERDLPFWRIPGTERDLLCDLWQPSADAPHSGIAVIYLHTGEWHFADKDFGTRPLFRHLTGQGHVVMDVAYRLCPETDLFGMLGDVKRAIAWIRTNTSQYAVDPNRIILAGGSAGGHLALLAAYTADRLELMPEEIRDVDVHVRGVVSYYGPPDLRAFFDDGYGRVNPPEKVEKIAGDMLGCSSEQRSELYRKGSPEAYITPNCPPTLLFQGQHDCGVPIYSTRAFRDKLLRAGVPVVYVEYPQTEHGFDLQVKAIASIARKAIKLPKKISSVEDISQYSPAAQTARYDLDRFLALMSI
jgi:acetyl esterase/lipase